MTEEQLVYDLILCPRCGWDWHYYNRETGVCECRACLLKFKARLDDTVVIITERELFNG